MKTAQSRLVAAEARAEFLNKLYVQASTRRKCEVTSEAREFWYWTVAAVGREQGRAIDALFRARSAVQRQGGAA